MRAKGLKDWIGSRVMDLLRSRFIKQSAWMTASSIANLVSGMFFVWGFGRWAGPAVLGLFTLAQRVGDFAFTILDLRIDEALTRTVIHYRGTGDRAKELSAILLAYGADLVLGLLAFGAVWIWIAPWAASYYAEPQIVLLVRIYGIALLVGTVNSSGVGVLQAFQRFEQLSVLFTAAAVLEAAFPLAAWFLGYGLKGVMASMVVFHAVYNAGLLILSWRLYRDEYRGVSPSAWREVGREMLSLGGLVTLSGTLKTAYRSLDVLILGRLASKEAVGFYRVAKSYGGMVGFFAGSVGTVLLPRLSVYAAAGDWTMFHAVNRRLMKWMTAASLPLGAGAVLLAPWVFQITMKTAYNPALPAVLWIVLASLLTNVTCYLRPAIIAVGKPEISVWSNVLMAGILVAACVWLVPSFQHVGAAQAWFAAHLAGVAFGAWMLSRHVRSIHPVVPSSERVLANASAVQAPEIPS